MEEDKVLDAMDHPSIISRLKMQNRRFFPALVIPQLWVEIIPMNSYPPLWKIGARGDFTNIILNSLFIPLCQRGIKTIATEVSPALFLSVFIFLFLFGCSLPKVTIPKDPLAPEDHLNLGVAYEKKGLLDSAIKEYKLAAKKLPIAYLYLGNAYFLKNELSQAEAFYKKMIKKDPQNGDAHNNLAWLYYTKRENLDAAEEYALRAIELNPFKGDIYRDTLEKIRELKKLQ